MSERAGVVKLQLVNAPAVHVEFLLLLLVTQVSLISCRLFKDYSREKLVVELNVVAGCSSDL